MGFQKLVKIEKSFNLKVHLGLLRFYFRNNNFLSISVPKAFKDQEGKHVSFIEYTMP